MTTLIWPSADQGLRPEIERASHVVVATELWMPSAPNLRCPASVMIAGELRYLGVPVTLGPVYVRKQHTGEVHKPVFRTKLGGGIGLGATAPARWRPTVIAVLASWLSVAGERTVLLPGPPSAVAEEADLVLVIGSANSSDSVRLPGVTRRCGPRTHLIGGATDIRASWLTEVRTIELAAGSSAPPGLIATIIAALEGLGPVCVRERESASEPFNSLPRLLRGSNDHDRQARPS